MEKKQLYNLSLYSSMYYTPANDGGKATPAGLMLSAYATDPDGGRNYINIWIPSGKGLIQGLKRTADGHFSVTLKQLEVEQRMRDAKRAEGGNGKADKADKAEKDAPAATADARLEAVDKGDLLF